jgi:hypothetical protein
MNQMDHVVYVVDDDPLVQEALSIVRSRVRGGNFKLADDVQRRVDELVLRIRAPRNHFPRKAVARDR